MYISLSHLSLSLSLSLSLFLQIHVCSMHYWVCALYVYTEIGCVHQMYIQRHNHMCVDARPTCLQQVRHSLSTDTYTHIHIYLYIHIYTCLFTYTFT